MMSIKRFKSSALTFVVETAVNQVGVDVNTASKSLLQYVSGLTSTIAQNIIDYRERNGPIKHHKKISSIKRLGAKTFEQSIGFKNCYVNTASKSCIRSYINYRSKYY